MGFVVGLAEAGVAVLVFVGVILGVRAFLQKQAPEGNSNDISNGDTML